MNKIVASNHRDGEAAEAPSTVVKNDLLMIKV